jgi:dATP pyrophosphohydrolase
MRAPYQILVFPFLKQNDEFLFCLFKREDLNVWQGIAGGGEEGESAIVTAKRESQEEAGISLESKILQLDSIGSIPVINISGFIWGKEVPIIPEYSFGIEMESKDITISHGHTTYEWVTYDQAMARLNWDSNKTALWELNYRLINNLLKEV